MNLGIDFELNQNTYIDKFIKEYFEDNKIGNSYIPMSSSVNLKNVIKNENICLYY
jgi:hypothetical protein